MYAKMEKPRANRMNSGRSVTQKAVASKQSSGYVDRRPNQVIQPMAMGRGAVTPSRDNGPLQLKQYLKTVKVKQKIGPKDDWGVIRGKLTSGGSPVTKGGKANSSIARNVNKSLQALGLNTARHAMSAHMIPNRLGGAGNDSNVRPWDAAFESGTWEHSVEKVFDAELTRAKVGDSLKYEVNTTELTNPEVQQIIDRSTVATEKVKPEHTDQIKKIPASVQAQVGSKSLNNTDACMANLIKAAPQAGGGLAAPQAGGGLAAPQAGGGLTGLISGALSYARSWLPSWRK